MIIKDLELKAFEILYQVPKGFFDNEHLIVDFEITNDISDNWDYNKGNPCCAGFLQGNKIIMYLAEDEHDQDFIQAVQKCMKDNSEKVFALNNNFESAIFQSYFDIQYVEVHEIKPFKAKYWNKEKFYKELIKEEQIPQLLLEDPLDFDGKKVPVMWEKYKETGDKDYLEKIAGHNLNCLLKESLILKHNIFFKQNYNINKKGWLVGIGKKKEIIDGKITKIFNKDNNAFIEVTISTKEGDKVIQLRSYYKMVEGKPLFFEGSNWHKYQHYYGKDPEVGDIVKAEPDSKGQVYHVLL